MLLVNVQVDQILLLLFSCCGQEKMNVTCGVIL